MGPACRIRFFEFLVLLKTFQAKALRCKALARLKLAAVEACTRSLQFIHRVQKKMLPHALPLNPVLRHVSFESFECFELGASARWITVTPIETRVTSGSAQPRTRQQLPKAARCLRGLNSSRIQKVDECFPGGLSSSSGFLSQGALSAPHLYKQAAAQDEQWRVAQQGQAANSGQDLVQEKGTARRTRRKALTTC